MLCNNKCIPLKKKQPAHNAFWVWSHSVSWLVRAYDRTSSGTLSENPNRSMCHVREHTQCKNQIDTEHESTTTIDRARMNKSQSAWHLSYYTHIFFYSFEIILQINGIVSRVYEIEISMFWLIFDIIWVGRSTLNLIIWNMSVDLLFPYSLIHSVLFEFDVYCRNHCRPMIKT